MEHEASTPVKTNMTPLPAAVSKSASKGSKGLLRRFQVRTSVNRSSVATRQTAPFCVSRTGAVVNTPHPASLDPAWSSPRGDLQQLEGNKTCVDCSARQPTWASVNMVMTNGFFVC